MTTALVLSGGGSLSSVQAGMLRALAEAGGAPDITSTAPRPAPALAPTQKHLPQHILNRHAPAHPLAAPTVRARGHHREEPMSSFASDVRPVFRDKDMDIKSMKSMLNLSS
jgi:hypothetical protein